MPCSSKPCVSTRSCRFLPLISLPASKPWLSMPAPRQRFSHSDCEKSMMQAVGLASQPRLSARQADEVERMMDRSRRAVTAVPQPPRSIMHGASGRRPWAALRLSGNWCRQCTSRRLITSPWPARAVCRRRGLAIRSGEAASICAHSAGGQVARITHHCAAQALPPTAKSTGEPQPQIRAPQRITADSPFDSCPKTRHPTHKVPGRTLSTDEKYELIELVRVFKKIVIDLPQQSGRVAGMDMYRKFVAAKLQVSGWLD